MKIAQNRERELGSAGSRKKIKRTAQSKKAPGTLSPTSWCRGRVSRQRLFDSRSHAHAAATQRAHARDSPRARALYDRVTSRVYLSILYSTGCLPSKNTCFLQLFIITSLSLSLLICQIKVSSHENKYLLPQGIVIWFKSGLNPNLETYLYTSFELHVWQKLLKNIKNCGR